jgi:HEPN domain-containing protein
MTHRARDAKDNFKQYFKNGREFYDAYEYKLRRRHYKNAAFQFHQATEHFYKTVLLVFTSYRPKGHFLDTLGSMCAGFDPRFLTVFPRQTENEKKCFDLLNSAYIDARYKKNYKTCARGGGYQKTPATIPRQKSPEITKTNQEHLQRKNRILHLVIAKEPQATAAISTPHSAIRHTHDAIRTSICKEKIDSFLKPTDK